MQWRPGSMMGWLGMVTLLLVGPLRAETLVRGGALDSFPLPQLKFHMERLADDSFEGREAGSRGGNAAAGYIMQQLRSLPLEPAGDAATYFQPFGDGYRNLLVLAPGHDPGRAHEVIVVGAHYDHVGYGQRSNSRGPIGYIHNGADDNASGTAALLELAAAWPTLQPPPARSLLVAFWDAEEKGLLGSRHWCATPTIDFSRVKAYVNCDMIGRLTAQRLEVFGTRTGQGWRQLVSRVNSARSVHYDFDWSLREDSDHFPFFQKQVPVLMLHTGLHNDYHRPSDDVERLNIDGTATITRLLVALAGELASAEVLPTFRAAAGQETNEHRRKLEAAVPVAPRFGATWEVQPAQADAGKRELVIRHVIRPSAADRAGIRVGDRLTHCQGEVIDDEQAFRRVLLRAAAPVSLRVVRQGIARELHVSLEGKPVQLGFSWRFDPAEPGIAIVTSVVYGSPAHEAGLQVGDRIWEVNAAAWPQEAGLAELLAKGTPLAVRYERRGQVQETELVPWSELAVSQ